MNELITLEDLIEFFGSKSEMARALNCTRQTLYNWQKRIPDQQLLNIEIATDGRFNARRYLEAVNSQAA